MESFGFLALPGNREKLYCLGSNPRDEMDCENVPGPHPGLALVLLKTDLVYLII
jgi:hypothetical protein